MTQSEGADSFKASLQGEVKALAEAELFLNPPFSISKPIPLRGFLGGRLETELELLLRRRGLELVKMAMDEAIESPIAKDPGHADPLLIAREVYRFLRALWVTAGTKASTSLFRESLADDSLANLRKNLYEEAQRLRRQQREMTLKVGSSSTAEVSYEQGPAVDAETSTADGNSRREPEDVYSAVRVQALRLRTTRANELASRPETKISAGATETILTRSVAKLDKLPEQHPKVSASASSFVSPLAEPSIDLGASQLFERWRFS